MIKTVSAVALAALTALSVGRAVADQSDVTFDQGSVLIICVPPEGMELTTEDFEKAFPRWIETMQTRADEGAILRAHYLGELKSGIFIVAGGENRDAAMDNAVAVSDELNAIFNEVTGRDVDGTCRFREIGPVAILPR